jgi:ankyrin repeat protein
MESNNETLRNTVNQPNNNGQTPLINAIKKNNLSLVRNLITLGAYVNMQNPDNYAFTPLFQAYISNASIEIIKLLIDSGANVDTENEDGYTLLMYICVLVTESSNKTFVEKYDMDVFQLLVDSGANIDLQDSRGNTPLILLSEYGVLPLMNILIDAGADVNIQSNDGETALIKAVIYAETTSSIYSVELLINAGADVSIEDKTGHNAIYYANKIENVEQRNMILTMLGGEQHNDVIYIDTSKIVEFDDPIMMTTENINIGEYIAEDPLNIVIMYNNDKYFFTNRNIIAQQQSDAIVYPCKIADTMRRENILTQKPLYDLKKIGLIVPFCDMKIYNEDPKYPPHQLFALINTNTSYPSFVSDKVLYDENVTFISRLHCQSGQESQLTKIVFAEPKPNVGGRKKKTKKRRYKNKTIRKRKQRKQKQTHRKYFKNHKVNTKKNKKQHSKTKTKGFRF